MSSNPRGATLVIVETIFIALDILAVAGRLWSRRIQNKALEFNDWSIIVALIIMIARYGNEISMVLVAGFGLHAADIEEKYGKGPITEFGMLSFSADMLWLSLVTIIKLSALDLYARIFRRPVFVRVCYVVFGICASAGIAFIFVRALICRPVAMNWDFLTPGGKCGDLHTMYLSLASIDLILDLLVVFLPMPVVWDLQMALSKKLAISAIFGLGAAICCITAVRLKFINEIDVLDVQYSQIKFNIFAALEPLLGIINACLPVMPPLIAKFSRGSAFRSTVSKGTLQKGSLSSSELKNYGSRKGVGMASSASTGRNFERLDDEYPLNDIRRNGGGATDSSEAFGNNIHVSRQWDLEYSSSKSDYEDSKRNMGIAR